MTLDLRETFGAVETKDQLLAALARQRGEIERAFSGLPLEEFFTPQGEHWSPAGHLRHLVKSVRPLAGALGIPKLLLTIRFGPARRSRSFTEVVELYRQQLAAGAQAGRFGPSSDGSEEASEDRRQEVLSEWRRAGERLVGSAAGWSDAAIDRCRLPHPVLGKLTVREILYFTLYHNAHHLRRVEERRTTGPVDRGFPE